MIREDIKSIFGIKAPETELYQTLLNCINLKDSKLDDHKDDVDFWFQGVIHSLWYKPNKTVLVLNGENLNTFFKHLFPRERAQGWKFIGEDLTKLYDSLLINYEFDKMSLNLPMCDHFRICEGGALGVYTDKRLASFCSTTNLWVYPQRKHYVVLNVESIDWNTYNDINKELLWAELYNRYKIDQDGK